MVDTISPSSSAARAWSAVFSTSPFLFCMGCSSAIAVFMRCHAGCCASSAALTAVASIDIDLPLFLAENLCVSSVESRSRKRVARAARRIARFEREPIIEREVAKNTETAVSACCRQLEDHRPIVVELGLEVEVDHNRHVITRGVAASLVSVDARIRHEFRERGASSVRSRCACLRSSASGLPCSPSRYSPRRSRARRR